MQGAPCTELSGARSPGIKATAQDSQSRTPAAFAPLQAVNTQVDMEKPGCTRQRGAQEHLAELARWKKQLQSKVHECC